MAHPFNSDSGPLVCNPQNYGHNIVCLRRKKAYFIVTKKIKSILSLNVHFEVVHCARLPAVQDIETGVMPKAFSEWTLPIVMALLNKWGEGGSRKCRAGL